MKNLNEFIEEQKIEAIKAVVEAYTKMGKTIVALAAEALKEAKQ